MTQLAGPITVNVERNRERALDLRAEGLTYQQIGEKLEISKTRAYELVREALDEVREENNMRAVHLRDLSLRRIYAIRAALWDNRGKHDVANALARLEQREADLLGLDAPKNIRLAGEGGGPIRQMGLVQLSEAERIQRLRELGLTGLLPALPRNDGDPRSN